MLHSEFRQGQKITVKVVLMGFYIFLNEFWKLCSGVHQA